MNKGGNPEYKGAIGVRALISAEQNAMVDEYSLLFGERNAAFAEYSLAFVKCGVAFSICETIFGYRHK